MVAKEQHFSQNLMDFLVIGYQVIYPSLTIFGIQVVNTEDKFCLESTISTYPGLLNTSTQYLCQNDPNDQNL